MCKNGSPAVIARRPKGPTWQSRLTSEIASPFALRARGRNDAGLTLLEVLLATVLVGLVGIAFAGLFATAQRYYIQTMNIASAQSEGSFALEHMRRKLIVATQLTLDSSTQVTFTAKGVQSRYLLSGTDLRYVPDISSATTELVARNVQTFVMSLPDPPPSAQTSPPQQPRLSILIVTERVSGGDTRQIRLETVISPRGV